MELPVRFVRLRKQEKKYSGCAIWAPMWCRFFHLMRRRVTRGSEDYVDGICEITGNEGIRTICAAEPIGPNNFLDIMVIAPCTGNTAAKLCNGITDTPVLMATKAHMRNGKPLVIAISTNDALGASFKNIGMLMNMKNIYFVPFGQDNCKSKPNSMIAKMELLPDTIEAALAGKQIQPILQTPT